MLKLSIVDDLLLLFLFCIDKTPVAELQVKLLLALYVLQY